MIGDIGRVCLLAFLFSKPSLVLGLNLNKADVLFVHELAEKRDAITSSSDLPSEGESIRSVSGLVSTQYP